MFSYLKDRYSLLNNLPVLKLDFGLGIFLSRGLNEYFFTPKHTHTKIKYLLSCLERLKDEQALLEAYKVAHIGRRRIVTYNGKQIIDNIQCNFDGYAYSLPMGLKHMLNQQEIVPILLIPNHIEDLNDSSKTAFKKLNILNLRKMTENPEILSEVEDNYYDVYFREQTADLSEIKPLGELIRKG